MDTTMDTLQVLVGTSLGEMQLDMIRDIECVTRMTPTERFVQSKMTRDGDAIIYVDMFGIPHRVDGPAYILKTPSAIKGMFDVTHMYFYHGVLHRNIENGKLPPAVHRLVNGVMTQEYWHLGQQFYPGKK